MLESKVFLFQVLEIVFGDLLYEINFFQSGAHQQISGTLK